MSVPCWRRGRGDLTRRFSPPDMSALGVAAFLVRIVKGYLIRDGWNFAAGVAHDQRRSLHRQFDRQAGDAHGPVIQRAVMANGDDADSNPIRNDRRAFGRGLGPVQLDAKDPEAFAALQAVVLLGAAKAGLAGRYGEIQDQFPQRVASRVIRERVFFGIVAGKEQQTAFGPQQVLRGEPAGDDARIRAHRYSPCARW